MIGKVFSVLVSSSFVFAFFNGRMDEVSKAVLLGAQEAVELSVAMLGFVCLWSGIIRVFEKSGVMTIISVMIRPILKLLYPKAYAKNCGVNEISANFAANLLGLGNAALPLGLSAMEKLSKLSEKKGEVNSEMITFSVMNTVPLQLFPTTLVVMRESAGSDMPYAVIVPIYICSVITILFAGVCCRVFGRIFFTKTR